MDDTKRAKQTKKRVAAALISDALAVALEGYWGEGMEDLSTGAYPSQEWMAEVTTEMQKILNPVFGRLERITKGFHVTDIKPVY